jgi:hypothetical protein
VEKRRGVNDKPEGSNQRENLNKNTSADNNNIQGSATVATNPSAPICKKNPSDEEGHADSNGQNHGKRGNKSGMHRGWTHSDTLTSVLALATVALVIVGGFQLFAMWSGNTQARAESAQAQKDTQNALAIAQQAANASSDLAKSATDNLSEVQRAFVTVVGINPLPVIDKQTGKLFFEMSPVLVNSGNTPTRDLYFYTGIKKIDRNEVKNFNFRDPIGVTYTPSLIGPRGTMNAGMVLLKGEDAEALGPLSSPVWMIWSTIHYKDIFHNQRLTEYCAEAVSSLMQDGQVTGLNFEACPIHNCADEECH